MIDDGSVRWDPVGRSTATASTGLEHAAGESWPLWSSAALTVSGLALIVLETTNLLVLPGLVLLGLGIYGLVYRRRPPSS